MEDPPELGAAVATVRDWVSDLMRRLEWQERSTAFRALLASFHALRDCLPRDEAVYLGLALPVLLRGLYFEGWRPARPAPAKTRKVFLQRVHDGVNRDPGVDVEQVAHAVFALLTDRLPAAEIENARAATPTALHGFWPA
jgi:uncharacterized protein (DUF2267 family)